MAFISHLCTVLSGTCSWLADALDCRVKVQSERILNPMHTEPPDTPDADIVAMPVHSSLDDFEARKAEDIYQSLRQRRRQQREEWAGRERRRAETRASAKVHNLTQIESA